MSSSYIFHAKLIKGLNPVDVWSSCLPIIENMSISMGDRYHLSSAAAKISVNVRHGEVDGILNYPGATSFLLSWRDAQSDNSMQFLSYFKNQKNLCFSIDENLTRMALDGFASKIFLALPLSNVLAQKETYLSTLDKFQNPGRNNLYLAPCYNNGRDGYIEGVSAEMWLGDPFWQHAKCTKEDVLRQDWLHCEERPSHLYVRAWPEPFSSAEGEQGVVQRRLLDLLFGINAKTPPPLPPPQQSTIVQKVLVDGGSVRDLGMEEVHPDGSRIQNSPPEPPLRS